MTWVREEGKQIVSLNAEGTTALVLIPAKTGCWKALLGDGWVGWDFKHTDLVQVWGGQMQLSSWQGGQALGWAGAFETPWLGNGSPSGQDKELLLKLARAAGDRLWREAQSWGMREGRTGWQGTRQWRQEEDKERIVSQRSRGKFQDGRPSWARPSWVWKVVQNWEKASKVGQREVSNDLFL